ncbi:hypothetical protein [Mesorhizobium japonicum]|uniref:Msl8061 protein n=1 Tax=Mesorhizobium japonicum (strain LMG 29417 / CECT 9101 / MAFF 303099) TaxID=266835 RepID=Q984C6_RHILO|nr:hypothetical protein [Mesorhizobium japonicum]BAB53704.1 msl8061 [Mesorhizobium japonicum MAFF 303099]
MSDEPIKLAEGMMVSLKRLIAADNMTQRENARTETQLVIARAMMRAGKPL